jgi:hypothetical protein
MTIAVLDEQGAPLAPVDQTPDGAPLAKVSQSAPESPEQAHVSLMWRWGRMMAASGFFNDSRQAAQAAVKIQAGHELGLPPGVAMRNLFFFDGKLSLATALMTSKVNQSPNYEFEVVETTDDVCRIEWWKKSKRTGAWRKLEDSKFDNADVKKAGLENKDNHKKYPRAMKFNRAMSAGCRMHCPEVFNGAVYTAEELGGDRVTIDETGNVLATDTNVPTAQPALVGNSQAASIAGAVRAARVSPNGGKATAEPAPQAPAQAQESTCTEDGAETPAAVAPAKPQPIPVVLKNYIESVAAELNFPEADMLKLIAQTFGDATPDKKLADDVCKAMRDSKAAGK